MSDYDSADPRLMRLNNGFEHPIRAARETRVVAGCIRVEWDGEWYTASVPHTYTPGYALYGQARDAQTAIGTLLERFSWCVVCTPSDAVAWAARFGIVVTHEAGVFTARMRRPFAKTNDDGCEYISEWAADAVRAIELMLKHAGHSVAYAMLGNEQEVA